MVYILICMLFVGYVNLFISLGFIIIYAVFIVIVVVQSKIVKVDDVANEDAYTKKASQYISVLQVVGQTQTLMRSTLHAKNNTIRSTIVK